MSIENFTDFLCNREIIFTYKKRMKLIKSFYISTGSSDSYTSSQTVLQRIHLTNRAGSNYRRKNKKNYSKEIYDGDEWISTSYYTDPRIIGLNADTKIGGCRKLFY